MIVTVTPNPAVDVTYTLPRLEVGGTNRATTTHQRAGGKGINVARVLHALGEPVLAVGFAGGRTGEVLAADITAAGIAHELVAVQGETRRTVTLLADGGATVVNEPGPAVTAAEWAALVAAVHAHRPTVLVVSGSLPPGAPADGVAALTLPGVPWVLDTSGSALATGLAARPTLVKPNAAELAALGRTASEVAAEHGCAVAVSHGADGLELVTAQGRWRGTGAPVPGNPTGAGDACVAGFARGLAHGKSLPDTVSDAVALAAAAVSGPYAGDVDLDHYRAYRVEVVSC